LLIFVGHKFLSREGREGGEGSDFPSSLASRSSRDTFTCSALLIATTKETRNEGENKFSRSGAVA
jgi:hypothetical protein